MKKGMIVLVCMILFVGCTQNTDVEKKNVENKTPVVNAEKAKTGEELVKEEKTQEAEELEETEYEKIYTHAPEIKKNQKVDTLDLNTEIDLKELQELSLQDLSVLRNKIYARHGYDFSTREYREYFSLYEWYDPIGKDVEGKFTKNDNVNMANIIYQQRKNLADLNFRKNSKIRPEYGEESSIYCGRHWLYIVSEETEAGGFTNHSIDLIFRTENHEIEYESGWNDGVAVFNPDFKYDSEWGYFIVTAFGTDISSISYVYKVNIKDGRIEKCGDFSNLMGKVLTADNGYLYFWGNVSDEDRKVDYIYNNRTGEIERVWDPILVKQITDIYNINMRENEEVFKYDIDYDNVVEDIKIEYTGDSNRGESYKIIVWDGDRKVEFQGNELEHCNYNLRFVPTKDKVYMVLGDDGPSDDPIEIFHEYTQGNIIKSRVMGGEMVRFTMDGNAYSRYSYLSDVPLYHYDIEEDKYVFEEVRGKRTYYSREVILYTEKAGVIYNPSMDYIEGAVAGKLEQGEEFEILELRFDDMVRNNPIKIRKDDGTEGWILWKDGGD